MRHDRTRTRTRIGAAPPGPGSGKPGSGKPPGRRGAQGIALAFVAADLLAVAAAFALAFLIAAAAHDLLDRPYFSFAGFLRGRGLQLGLLPVLMVAIFAFGSLYARTVWEAEEVRRIAWAVALLGLIEAALQIAAQDAGSRLWFLIVWPLLAFLVIVFRAALRLLPAMRRALTSHVLLVGQGISAEVFAFQLREAQANPILVIADVPMAEFDGLAGPALAARAAALAANGDPPLPPPRPPPCPSSAPPAGLHLVLVPDADEREASRDLAARLWSAGLPFSVAVPDDVVARRGLRLRKITGLDLVLAEQDEPRAALAGRMPKRIVDLALTLPGLALLAPAMLVIALLLMRDGDVFFRQSRVGQGGRRFDCLKFRSMRSDAEARLAGLLAADPEARAQWASHQKLADDPRITPFGRFLRTSSLDELPQLLNVLRGEMSLVGPRPIVAPEVPGYHNDRAYFDGEDFEWYASCRPGITGLWQVSGRATNAYEERVRLDCWYARNWSIWLDIAILLKTLRVVLVARTAS
jgi:undecaprenyl-phosphate galactose phosphotransferase